MGVRILAAVACLLGLALPRAALSQAPQVTLGGVTVQGIAWPVTSGVNAFLGIRYAASPEAGNRWFPPQPPAGLPSGDATQYANACPQGASTLETALAVSTDPPTLQTVAQAEDCLFLNVFVPASATPSAKLPVLVWIHGGALVAGSGAQYDPSVMVANGNIIVVTINYRLGALGWLAESALQPGKNGIVPLGTFMHVKDAGNYGLMDQQFALQWVQSNIAAFGGDPAKVTIGGESAGGLSTLSHLASLFTARGLFRAAIVESGAYALHDLPTRAEYETAFGNGFVKRALAAGAAQSLAPCAGVTRRSAAAAVLACLDAIPAATLYSVQTTVFGADGVSPAAGTRILPDTLFAAYSNGKFFRVPVLHGSNANEGRYFEPLIVPLEASLATIVAAGGPANYDLGHSNKFCGGGTCGYQQEIHNFLSTLGVPSAVNGIELDTALDLLYPLSDFGDPDLAGGAASADEALAQIFTDLVFACNAFDVDHDLSRFAFVWAYEFSDPRAPPTLGAGPAVTKAPNDQFGFPTAAEHGAELQFLFDFGTSLSPAEVTLATEMKAYWTNFVSNLNPNRGTTEAHWISFNSGQAIQALIPGATPQPGTSFSDDHNCALWEPILVGETALAID
jgi:para-nitrobenzyl esterase